MAKSSRNSIEDLLGKGTSREYTEKEKAAFKRRSAIASELRAEVDILEQRSAQLDELTERAAKKAMQAVSVEEGAAQQTLAGAYVEGNVETAEVVKEYIQSIQNIYYKSTQVRPDVSLKGNPIEQEYLPLLDEIIVGIIGEPASILSDAQRQSLLNFATKVQTLLKHKVTRFAKIKTTTKTALGKLASSTGTAIGSIAEDAAQKNIFVAMGLNTFRGIQSATRLFKRNDNTKGSFFGAEAAAKRKRLDILSRQSSSASAASVDGAPSAGTLGGLTASPIEEDVSGGGGGGLGNKATLKVLNTHTVLLQKIYGVLKNQFDLQRRQLQLDTAANEESLLESQDSSGGRGGLGLGGGKGKGDGKGKDDGKGGGDSWMDDIFGGALGTALGNILPAIIKNAVVPLTLGGMAYLGADLLRDKYAPNFLKSPNGNDALAGGIAGLGAGADAGARAARDAAARARTPATPVEPVTVPKRPIGFKPPPTAFRPSASQPGSVLFNPEEGLASLGGKSSTILEGLPSASKVFTPGALGKNALFALPGAYFERANRKEAGQTEFQADVGTAASVGAGILASMYTGAAIGGAGGSLAMGVGAVPGAIIGGLVGLGTGLAASYGAGKIADWATGADQVGKAGKAIQDNLGSIDGTLTFSKLTPEQQEILLSRQAIAEGWNATVNGGPSAPNRANNPGALLWGSFAAQNGAIGAIPVEGGKQLALFPDFATGRNAQKALWNSEKYRDMPLPQAIQYWRTGKTTGDSSAAAVNYQNILLNGSNQSMNMSDGNASPSAPNAPGGHWVEFKDSKRWVPDSPTPGATPVNDAAARGREILTNTMTVDQISSSLSQLPNAIALAIQNAPVFAAQGNGNISFINAPLDPDSTIRRVTGYA